jgi:light-regulated signal transduction histidine kinase (bacteriophytochrome)
MGSFAQALGCLYVLEGATLGGQIISRHVQQLWGLHLPAVYPRAQGFKQVASGLLAIPLSRVQKNYVCWFRPEVIQTVDWAGKPEKAVQVGEDGLRLSPRKSFDLWRETVGSTSLPWKRGEVEAAAEPRNAIIDVVLHLTELKRAEQAQRSVGRAFLRLPRTGPLGASFRS